MMISEHHHLLHPTVQIPQWDPFDDPTADVNSPFQDYNIPFAEFDALDDAFASDNFRMYDFKVRRCAQGRSHDWTECPFAHPGEKARRRDLRKHSYAGTACAEFRKGSCRRGDACEFAHGVFECWLHPEKYRTQACKDGIGCRRRICFFAHSPEQLRLMSNPSPRKSPMSSNSTDSYDGSPLRRSFGSYMCNKNNTSPFEPCVVGANTSSFGSSSSPTSPTSSSPPMSPLMSASSYGAVNELVSNMRNLQLAKALISPRGSNLRPGFASLPTTPTRVPARLEQWDCTNSINRGYEEEPLMERVESGRDLRTKLYARLSKENSFGPVNDESHTQVAVDQDVGWISDLIE